jgi:TetR/AcrR family transcriptional regulator
MMPPAATYARRVTARARGRPASGDEVVTTERVLDAALDAFADRGYEGMSVRELARSLGVSHNMIPQRIGTKEDLWRRSVDRGFGHLAGSLASVELPEDATDLERLRAVVVRFIEANAARPALLRIISREAVAPGPRYDYLFEQFIDPVRQFGAELLARLEAAGDIRTRSVSLVYFFMTHGAGGPLALPALADSFGDPVDRNDPEAVRLHAEEATALLFDGLVARRR